MIFGARRTPASSTVSVVKSVLYHKYSETVTIAATRIPTRLPDALSIQRPIPMHPEAAMLFSTPSGNYFFFSILHHFQTYFIFYNEKNIVPKTVNHCL